MSKVQKKKRIIVLAIILAIVSFSCIFYNYISQGLKIFLFKNFSVVSSDGNLLVHFISVGQGDAIAINLPDGKVLVIDSGPASNSDDCVNYLKNKVVSNSKDKQIDYLFFSHADADHTGGGAKILKSFKVVNVVFPLVDKTSSSYNKLKSSITNENVITYENDCVIFDTAYKFEMFVDETSSEPNNSSYVFKLTYTSKSFLFAGDIERDAELNLVNELGDKLDCDVLKVAHHGSTTSSCQEFLNVATPEFSVISAGFDNTYGHPHDEVLDRLDEMKSKIIRTDLSGNIVFTLGDDYSFGYKTGNYYITGLTLDYRILVLVVDAVLIIVGIKVLLTKEKKKRRKTMNKI